MNALATAGVTALPNRAVKIARRTRVPSTMRGAESNIVKALPVSVAAVSPLVCAAPEAFALDRLADISEGPVALYFGLELGAALIGTMGIYYVLNKIIKLI